MRMHDESCARFLSYTKCGDVVGPPSNFEQRKRFVAVVSFSKNPSIVPNQSLTPMT